MMLAALVLHVVRPAGVVRLDADKATESAQVVHNPHSNVELQQRLRLRVGLCRWRCGTLLVGGHVQEAAQLFAVPVHPPRGRVRDEAGPRMPSCKEA